MHKVKQAWDWYESHSITIIVGFDFNITRWAWLPVLGRTPAEDKSHPDDFEYGLVVLGFRFVFGWYKVLPEE